jgi:integrase/ribosomal protein L40E
MHPYDMVFSNLTIEYERSMLTKEQIPEVAKKAIINFVDGDLLLENIGEKRRMNYYQRLRVVARWIPDNFTNPSKDDVKKIMVHLNDGYSDWTKSTYLKMLKKFYRKTLPKKRFETLFEDVKIKQPKQKIQQSDLVTPEEVKALIDAANNARDRAIFSTLYDSGCRIGELLLMKIRSVAFDGYGAILAVPFEGKTGTRSVRIVGDSVPYLRAWLDNHPKRNDMNAPLFCNISETIRGRAMTYDDIRKALINSTKRAGITKRIYPHLFRHTRATILASKLAEAPLEAQMGWIPGTKQMGTYVHLSGKQTDEAILKAYGIEVNESGISEPKPSVCPRCGEINPSNGTYCRKCWLPLSTEAALELKEKESHIQTELEIKGIISPQVKALIENMPETERTGILASIIELALKEKEKPRN